MAVDCCNLSEMIGLIAHQKPVVYLSLDQRPENRNGFRFVKQRKQTAERLQQSIGNSTYPDTRSRVSFLTGGRLPGQLIPLARAGQAYRLRRRRAGMSKPAIFPNWPAGQERLSGIFPHYIHKVHPNPHDLRAIGHQNDTGRTGSLPGSRFVSAKQFEPFYGGREIAGAGCALCNIPR